MNIQSDTEARPIVANAKLGLHLMRNIVRARFLRYFLFALLIVILLRTILIKPHHVQTARTEQDWGLNLPDDEQAIQRLRKCLMFRTISIAENKLEFMKLIDFIESNFPTVHSSKHVTVEVLNHSSVLYYVKGSDPTLKPYLLAGHLDVVPVELQHWRSDPFAAKLSEDGFIYGRGTIDAKYIVMGILEALEHRLKQKFQPQRSFYVAFGNDEESSGNGAKHISRILTERKVHLEFILDEGIFIIPGTLLSLSTDNVAIIGVTEKGYASLNISVYSDAGHSSMSQVENAAIILSKAVSKLNGNCYPNVFGSGPEWDLFEAVAPYVKMPTRILIANLWLFRYLLGWYLEQNALTNPLTRTTTSVTMFYSGYKENVIPSTAWAIVNHRIHPASNSEEVIEYTKNLINDNRVKVNVVQSYDPHPVSPHGNSDFGYQIIKETVEEIYESTAVVPGIMLANTDCQAYLSLTDAIYRFGPLQLSLKDLGTIHGHNERVSVKSYKKAIQYYHRLILNADKAQLNKRNGHSTEL